MKRYLPFAIIAVVAFIAVASGVLLYRAKKAEVASMVSPATLADGDDPTDRQSGANPPHVRGGAKGSVTIEEFGDFQCPPCGTLSTVLEKLEHDYGARLRVVFRQYPLKIHSHAEQAARVAEAAGLQDHFWEMHDLLYRNQLAWSKEVDATPLFTQYATTLGLDQARFGKDIENERVKERVAADQRRAESLGVTSTPTLFLNNERVPQTSVTEQGLRTAIDAALSGKPPEPLPLK